MAYRGGGGAGGGHGPRAQTLEGAPAQLVEVNFKSRAIKGPSFFLFPDLFFFFFFCLSIFVPGPKGFVLPKGGRQGGGALIRGGGGADRCRALETLGTPLTRVLILPHPTLRISVIRITNILKYLSISLNI